MDTVDQAKIVEEKWRNKRIAAARTALQKHGAVNCIDCGEVIPEARRRAYPAAERCVACQQEVENARCV